jgi:hypothetical protein
MSAERKLALETQAAQAMRAVLETMTDDGEAIRDTLEGETNLHALIAKVLEHITEDEMLIAGIVSMVASLEQRLTRLHRRIDHRRTAIERAMVVGEIQKLELPGATISQRRIPPALHIVNEAEVPWKFLKQPPAQIDKAALKDALKDGETVPGASLDNGGVGISIRRS